MDRGPDRILDEYLVVMSQAGSREALGRLVARWSPRLLRYSARTLGAAEGAEDVVQETWGAALRVLPQLDDSARFPAWIYAIATRRCADLVRRRQRAQRTGDRLAAEETLNGHAVAPAGETGLDLTAALRRLPMDQRLTVSLHYGEDLSVEEVAAVLGVPVGTVKSRLHTARKALKLFLEGPQP
ncbi:MAG: sigma-70 family RNA polymerase sigma factor [Phenylobacterium sp.]